MKLVLKTFAVVITMMFLFLSGCQKEISCEDCAGTNIPPIANAGSDLFIAFPKDSVLLDGSGSTDTDGSIARYNWRKISGPPSFSIESATLIKPTVKKLVVGVYHFELVVIDNQGLTSADTVAVTVDKKPVNHSPIAVAGPDQAITLPKDTILLDGSKSWDPDSNIIGYAWRKISGPNNLKMSDPVQIQNIVVDFAAGIYYFELAVTDAEGLTGKDTIQVIVNISPDKPPIANAGPDATVSYNLQTCSMEPSVITLDGTGSSDPDGTIVSYHWSLIFANSDLVITNPNTAIATVTKIQPVNYTFRLVVTDNAGGKDDDTVIVNTNITNRSVVNAQLIPIGTLSEKRKVSVLATAGNKLFFAGGDTPPLSPGAHPSSRVDIFDLATNVWSTAELSQPRWGLTAAVSGNRVYFAGGKGFINGGSVGLSSRVDVYDIVTDSWSILEMPRPGWFTSLVQGKKIFFAGGSDIDIYDASTDRWSKKTISQPRYQITATRVLGKLYFAGGSSGITGGTPYSQVDIYDPSTNNWTVSNMSQAKYGMAGIGLRTQCVWAGGKTDAGNTNQVEMLDINTLSTTFSCLFQPNAFSNYSVAKLGNKFAFFVWDGAAKDRFDIYDAVTNTWTIGLLDQAITPSMVISANNSIYIAGGYGNSNGYYDQVWKLVF
jgi:Kelch motif